MVHEPGKGKGKGRLKPGEKRKPDGRTCTLTKNCCHCHLDSYCDRYCHTCYLFKEDCAGHTSKDVTSPNSNLDQFSSPARKKFQPPVMFEGDQSFVMPAGGVGLDELQVVPEVSLTTASEAPEEPDRGNPISVIQTTFHSLPEEALFLSEEDQDFITGLMEQNALIPVDSGDADISTTLLALISQFSTGNNGNPSVIEQEVHTVFAPYQPMDIELLQVEPENYIAQHFMLFPVYDCGAMRLLLVIRNFSRHITLFVYLHKDQSLRIYASSGLNLQAIISSLLTHLPAETLGNSNCQCTRYPLIAFNLQNSIVGLDDLRTVARAAITSYSARCHSPSGCVARVMTPPCQHAMHQPVTSEESIDFSGPVNTLPLGSTTREGQASLRIKSEEEGFDVRMRCKIIGSHDSLKSCEFFFIDDQVRRRLAIQIMNAICTRQENFDSPVCQFHHSATYSSGDQAAKIKQLPDDGFVLIILHSDTPTDKPLVIFVAGFGDELYLSLHTFSDQVINDMSIERFSINSRSQLSRLLLELLKTGVISKITIYSIEPEE